MFDVLPSPIPNLHPPSSSILLLLHLFSAGSGFAATRYVWQESPSPAPPYTTWATAATNIQDAVDEALAGDEIVVRKGLP